MTSPTPNWISVWDTVNKLKTQVDELRLKVANMKPDLDAVDTADDLAKVFQIKHAVCDAFGLKPSSMTQRDRPDDIAWPRQIAMTLARESTRLSLTAIGKRFGNRDHGTVLHAIAKVKDRTATEPQAREVVRRLRVRIAGVKRGGGK